MVLEKKMKWFILAIYCLNYSWGLSSLVSQNETLICGLQFDLTPRIIGGSKSRTGLWPWQIRLMVSVEENNEGYHTVCGAALINKNYAITAAHCIVEFHIEDIILLFGEHNLLEANDATVRKVEEIQIHPKFSLELMNYDIATLKFDFPIVYQLNIIPICLPPNNKETFAGKQAIITGWGFVSESGPSSPKLRHLSLPVIEYIKCYNMYKKSGIYIPKHVLCAGWPNGHKDSCEGDSGGPLVYYSPEKKRYVLIGIMSWGIGCAQPFPGVYTRITYFTKWIKNKIKN